MRGESWRKRVNEPGLSGAYHPGRAPKFYYEIKGVKIYLPGFSSRWSLFLLHNLGYLSTLAADEDTLLGLSYAYTLEVEVDALFAGNFDS